MTVVFQCMFGILERWNNNQVTPSLSTPHELSYRSNIYSEGQIEDASTGARYSKNLFRSTSKLSHLVFCLVSLQDSRSFSTCAQK